MKNVGDLARRFLSQDRHEHPVEGSRQQDPNAGFDPEAGGWGNAGGSWDYSGADGGGGDSFGDDDGGWV